MFRNYIKVALRSLSRNKTFSLINIIGLAVGLTTCLLIMLYVADERSYDSHHNNGDRIFRVASTGHTGESWAAGPAPLAAGLSADFPEVETSARLMTFPDISTMLIKHGEGEKQKRFFEDNGYYVDSGFFKILTYKFKYGNAGEGFNAPNSILLSDEMAAKYFGNDDPVGESMQVTTPFGEMNYTVKGVFETKGNKSHIPANFFLSMRNNDMWLWVQTQTRWATNNIFFTYLKLKEGANASVFEQKMNNYFRQKAGEEMQAGGFSKEMFLQPVNSIHLYSKTANEIGVNGNISFLYILISIAIFILLIACINFMNLSTARSQKRAKEVGIRKVIGAKRNMLIGQFLGESFIMSLLALILATVLTIGLLPAFNALTQKQIGLTDQPILLLWMAALVIVTGLLAGIYPAFYLSSFRPIRVLKGKMMNNFSAGAVRKGLVVFQFTISTCLIFSAIVVWQQLDLLKNQDLGFNKDHQLVVPMAQAYKNSENYFTPFKNELKKLPGVKAVTSGSTYPGIPNLNDMLFYAEGKSPNETVDIMLASTGNDYIETMGMKMMKGRAFSDEFTADSASIIVNEAAVKQLGYTMDDVIGKKINYNFAGFNGSLEIVGVVGNFNFQSLHNDIRPHGFTTGLFSNKYGYILINLNTTDYASMLSGVGAAWRKLFPDVPFTYSFVDKDFQANYEKEQRTSSMVIYFTIIAIVIACLGLFGLAAFSAEQRTKEIGIRKVIGATVTDITSLLSKEFIRLILLAIIIAVPLAWFFMNSWLQDFAFRVTISWWIIAAAGIPALLIAMMTISFQAVKAALANPVRSLRNE